MDLVRTYGNELAVLVVTARRAQIEAGGSTAVLDVGEEIGCHAVVNRAVAGLAVQFGLVALTTDGVGRDPGTLDALRDLAARRPRAGLLAPLPHPSSGATVRPPVPALRRRRFAPLRRSGRPGRGDRGGAGVPGLGVSPLLLRRAAFDSVDGYDTRLTEPGRADAELVACLVRAGWLVVTESPLVTDLGRRGSAARCADRAC